MSERRRPRSYRELQADAQAEPSPPPGLPERSPGDREKRRQQLEQSWRKIRDQLERDVDELAFGLWIAELSLVDAAGDVLFVAAPDRAASWVRTRYTRLIEAAVERASGRALDVCVFPASTSGATTTVPPELQPETREG